MADVDGRVALVTGSDSGIGRATALEFAARGVAVRVADEALDGADETVASIVEVASEDSVEAMVEATTRAFGRRDALVA